MIYNEIKNCDINRHYFFEYKQEKLQERNAYKKTI